MWSWLKWGRLANFVPDDLTALGDVGGRIPTSVEVRSEAVEGIVGSVRAAVPPRPESNSPDYLRFSRLSRSAGNTTLTRFAHFTIFHSWLWKFHKSKHFHALNVDPRKDPEYAQNIRKRSVRSVFGDVFVTIVDLDVAGSSPVGHPQVK